MERRAGNANVVDFPPPLTEGEKEWDRRLTTELRAHLPEDRAEAQEVLTIVKEVIAKRSSGERAWKSAQQAAYLVSMFPEDYRAVRRIISLLGEDGA
jgi:hypothetical protein